MDNVRVYTTGAYPVVHMPGRKFPGVVVQGDTLSIWCSALKELLSSVEEQNRSEEYYSLLMLYEDAKAFLDHYEETLEKQGMELPYVKKG